METDGNTEVKKWLEQHYRVSGPESKRVKFCDLLDEAPPMTSYSLAHTIKEVFPNAVSKRAGLTYIYGIAKRCSTGPDHQSSLLKRNEELELQVQALQRKVAQ